MNSEEENIRFVQCIERYPCIYDNTMKTNFHRSALEKAWCEIASQFNNMSVSECKNRWRNIRTVFRRHVFAATVGTASRKTYYLTDVLQFLVPMLNIDQKEQVDIKIENCDVTSDGSSPLWDGIQQEEQLTLHQAKMSINETEYWKNMSHKRRNDSDNTDECISEYQPNKTKRIECVSTLSSETDTQFLLSLREDMSEMNSRQKRQFKRGIYDLIEKVMGESTNPLK